MRPGPRRDDDLIRHPCPGAGDDRDRALARGQVPDLGLLDHPAGGHESMGEVFGPKRGIDGVQPVRRETGMGETRAETGLDLGDGAGAFQEVEGDTMAAALIPGGPRRVEPCAPLVDLQLAFAAHQALARDPGDQPFQRL